MNKIVEILIYIFLGIVQGVSEILPISSSGHLALIQNILNINKNNEGVFSIFLHFASLVALIIFFRKDILKMIKGTFYYIFKKDKNYKDDFMLVIYIVIASIPVGIAGVLLSDKIDTMFSNLFFIGLAFLFTSLILFLVSKLKDTSNNNNNLSFKSAIIVGLFQLIGIFPGISRSGITMSGGKFAKLDNQKAKHFAFLLFIPVALGSFLFSIDDLYLIGKENSNNIILYIISMIVSGVFTYISLIFIFKKFNIQHYKYFAIYMLIIGIFTLSYYLIYIK